MSKQKSIIPGFSWNRALGITKAKQDIARKTGIPTTKEGRKRKVERLTFNILTASIALYEAEKIERKQALQLANEEFAGYVKEKMKTLNLIAERMRSADVLSAFFTYIDKYIDTLDELIVAKTPNGLPLNPSPADVKAQFISDMPQRINNAIDRSWKRWQEEAFKLKTERGMKTRLKSFFPAVLVYSDRFTQENRNYIYRLWEEARRKYELE